MKEHAVSEIIGTLTLIGVVVLGIIIVNVVILSQPRAARVPSIEAMITNNSKLITITHQGGDTLIAGQYKILVDGVDRTGNFANSGGAGPFSAGETLTWNDPDMPQRVVVIYNGMGTGEVQILATRFPYGVFLPPYANTSTPTPIVPPSLPSPPTTPSPPAPASPAWYSCNWLYRKNITIVRAKVSGSPSTDFPVLISTTDKELIGNTTSNGYDILFTDGDGITQLPYERESYNSGTGALTAWVKVQGLSATMIPNKSIYMYYGFPSTPLDNQYPSAVWDANYKGVWHMDENPAGAAPQINDSTLIYNGTSYGTMTSSDQVTGKINGALDFDGSNDYINTSYTQTSVSAYTIEAWIKTSTSTKQSVIVQDRGGVSGNGPGLSLTLSIGGTYPGAAGNAGDVAYGVDSNSIYVGRYSTTATVNNNVWRHVAGVWSGGGSVTTGQFSIYIDGSPAASTAISTGSATAPLTGYQGTTIGYHQAWNTYLTAQLDEIRVSTSARSADWIATEYNNTYSPNSFYKVNASERWNSGWSC
jgi:hypothetical protein